MYRCFSASALIDIFWARASRRILSNVDRVTSAMADAREKPEVLPKVTYGWY